MGDQRAKQSLVGNGKEREEGDRIMLQLLRQRGAFHRYEVASTVIYRIFIMLGSACFTTCCVPTVPEESTGQFSSPWIIFRVMSHRRSPQVNHFAQFQEPNPIFLRTFCDI